MFHMFPSKKNISNFILNRRVLSRRKEKRGKTVTNLGEDISTDEGHEDHPQHGGAVDSSVDGPHGVVHYVAWVFADKLGHILTMHKGQEVHNIAISVVWNTFVIGHRGWG